MHWKVDPASSELNVKVAVVKFVGFAGAVKIVVLGGVVSGTTVKAKLCVASGKTPFEAVIAIGYVPAVAETGVPESVAVPLPLSVKVTPEGSAPVSVMADSG